jgi:hypothetical protein
VNNKNEYITTATFDTLNPAGTRDAIQTGILDANGTFGGWKDLRPGVIARNSGGWEVLARSAGGKIGLAYPNADTTGGRASYGIVFTESADSGHTWSAPELVFQPTILSSQLAPNPPDTLEFGTSLDLKYLGEEPHIAFEATVDFLYRTEQILHWSRSGGVSEVVMADTMHGIGASTLTNANSQPNMSPISYPCLGFSDDGSKVFVLFSAISQTGTSMLADDFSGTSFNYYQVWAVGSSDGGSTWGSPNLMNGPSAIQSGEAFDSASFEYPVLAPSNHIAGGVTTLQMVFQVRRHPGMYAFTINGTNPSTPGPINQTWLMYQATQFTPAMFLSGVPEPADLDPLTPLMMSAYPNPASASSMVQFDLVQPANVTLQVVDVMGRIVTTLHRGIVSAGMHSYNTDLSILPSGTYFAELRSAGGARLARAIPIAKR